MERFFWIKPQIILNAIALTLAILMLYRLTTPVGAGRSLQTAPLVFR